MNEAGGGFVRVGLLSELRARRRTVIGTPGGAVLVVADGEDVVALDNRCPHMGFPLHRGSIEDGILTCHWHHARFDLRSGSTFDLWADDVPVRAVRIVDGVVWVAAEPAPREEAVHWRRRLHDGLAHNINLVIGKAVLGATGARVPTADLLRDALLYGAGHRDRWGAGLTTLIALADLIPVLDEDDRYLALFHGIGAVAATARGRRRAPTASRSAQASRSTRWRAGSATGCACATARARSAPCAPRSPPVRRRNGSRPPP